MVFCSGRTERRHGAAAGLSAALQNRQVSEKFLPLQGRRFREAPSVEPIPTSAISVYSVNDLQGRQLLPGQLITSALQINQENRPGSRYCDSSYCRPTTSAAGFRESPYF